MTSLFEPLFAVAAEAPPAGGAELTQIVIATVAATVLTGALLFLGFGHRTGRIDTLARVAALAERHFAFPGWVALPVILTTTSLIVALIGMYWDISLHIDNGRDAGPLANPAHYFILAGLFGIFSAGFLAMVLPKERPSTVAIRIGRDWWAPLGGVLICACGAFSLIGFPLDDVWHRLFGQDVTLWGATHLMLIGGAAMALIGITVLSVEGVRANEAAGRGVEVIPARMARSIAGTGGLLLGLSTFQAEFDFGVPQFQMIFEPVMLMLSAGIGLVVARIYAGPGAAFGAALFFILLRGGLALGIGPGLGETTPHFPLYLAEALVVEALALRLSTERPLRFGLWAGAGIGTVGLAAEWLWSHVWMPIPWTDGVFPEAALLGFAAAIAGAVVGAWIGSHLSPVPAPQPRSLRNAAVAAAAVIFALVAYGLHTPTQEGISGQVTLRELPGEEREVEALVRMDPPQAPEDPAWFNVTAWQGGGLVVNAMEEVQPGVYRTTEPIPVHGTWKALLRLHEGSSLAALPIFLPSDPAIPLGETPAKAVFTRPFGEERQLLQREARGGSTLISVLSYATVAGITISLLSLLAWALHRLANDGATRRGRRRPVDVRRPVGEGAAGG
jgi:hypothetical protein